MIKSLFGEDEAEAPRKENRESEDEIKRQLDAMNRAAEMPQNKTEIPPETATPAAEWKQTNFVELPQDEFFSDNFPAAVQPEEIEWNELSASPPPVENAPDGAAQANQTPAAAGNLFQTAEKSLTAAETIRQSGMAWSAAIGLFGSVLFMLILGWFFDVLTGASPWGLVGGIVIGAAIGFYQFFRVTSQIFKND